jgi:hypothetical protein
MLTIYGKRHHFIIRIGIEIKMRELSRVAHPKYHQALSH